MAGLQDLLKELRRRRVFRAAGLYIVGAWVAVQVASLVFPAIDVPDSAIRYVWLAALVLFPLCLVFSWFYEVTPVGIQRTPPRDRSESVDPSLRRADIIVLGALGIVAAAIAWQISANIRDVSSDPAVAGPTGSVEADAIAVLPLTNASGDPGQQYFVAGMHDALIAGLSRIRDLTVISKPSTLRFANTTSSLPQIASRLGVGSLIQGSVERFGDDVRVSVKLIDAAKDEQVWRATFEERLEDVLRLQNDLAHAIATEVAGVVAQAPGLEPRPVNTAAYEAYLRGQFHLERFTPQDMQAAERYYRQAAELDPNYALAHWGLGRLCGFKTQAGFLSPEEAREQCLPPIVRALQLDPYLPQAHMGFGTHMTWQRFAFEEAGSAFEKAIELNPSFAEARMFYSHFLGIIGNLDESTRQMALARELDPLNPFVQGLHGVQRLMVDDPQGAIELIESSMADAPGFGFGYNVLWGAYWEVGRLNDSVVSAISWLKRFEPDHPGARTLAATWESGDFEAAMRAAANAVVDNFDSSPVPPTTVGLLFEQAGEAEEAIDWYEIAYRRGDPEAPYLGATIGGRSVQTNPRFIALLREMELDYWADRYSASGY